MRLTDPTDYKILAILEARGRNTAANISEILDLDRSYVNAELSKLRGTDLVEHIGPVQHSGLYEVTANGENVVDHWKSNGPIQGDHRQVLK